MKRIIYVVFLFMFSLQGHSQSMDQSINLLKSAQSTLKEMAETRQIQFPSDTEELRFMKTMSSLQNATTQLESLKAAAQSNSKIDLLVADARLVQKIMASYFGTKDMFGYKLRTSRVEIYRSDINASANLRTRLGFLGNVSVDASIGNSVVVANNQAEIVSQFNSLKTEFLGILIEVAHINKNDSRLGALAKWGRDTKVIYPGQSFGEDIISFSDYNKIQ